MSQGVALQFNFGATPFAFGPPPAPSPASYHRYRAVNEWLAERQVGSGGSAGGSAGGTAGGGVASGLSCGLRFAPPARPRAFPMATGVQTLRCVADLVARLRRQHRRSLTSSDLEAPASAEPPAAAAAPLRAGSAARQPAAVGGGRPRMLRQYWLLGPALRRVLRRIADGPLAPFALRLLAARVLAELANPAARMLPGSY